MALLDGKIIVKHTMLNEVSEPQVVLTTFSVVEFLILRSP